MRRPEEYHLVFSAPRRLYGSAKGNGPPRVARRSSCRSRSRPGGTRASRAAGARQVSGWPKRCKLAHAFMWEYSYKRLKLAQLLGRLGVVLTCTPTPMVSPMFIVACTHPQGTNSTSPVCCRHPTGLRSTGSVGRISLSQWLKLTSGSGMSAVSILLGSYRNQAFDPAVKYSHDCPVIARMVLGWPKRCKLVHAFLWIKWEYSY